MHWTEIVGFVGSLASIVGLPIAIWQICSAKSKIQTAEDAIKKLTEINKFQKYDGIIKTLEETLNTISAIISTWNKQGVNKDEQAKSVQGMIKSINRCIVEMPDGTEKRVIDALKSSVGFLESAVREEKIESLRGARGQLNSSISLIKTIAEKITDEEGRMIARSQ